MREIYNICSYTIEERNLPVSFMQLNKEGYIMSHDAMVMLHDTDMLSGISLELLDRLQELLEEADGAPALQTKIYELVQWVEAHVSPSTGDDGFVLEPESNTTYSDDFFATLMFQAQQQNQQ
jgi:hypothetical protein